ncbi:MAG: hypothetical protein K2N27_06230 [Ruminococcus sp.]|nr:hypothetical protein [Ruminococcus sp.]
MKKFLIFISALMLMSVTSCSAQKESNEIQESSETTTENTKNVITVGSMDYYDPLFDDYLAMPKDIEVKIINYYDENDEFAFDRAVASGEMPDILCLPVDDMQKMINHGTMADLYVFMDEYDNLKRDDFTDMALDGLTVDGKLPAIMERYSIRTAFAKTKFVGSESRDWTAEQAMYFYSTMPENMQFLHVYDDMGVADYMLKLEGLNCIDMKNNVCDFGGAFTDLLDFCKNNPIMYDTYTAEGVEFPGMDDSELVFKLRIHGFNSSLAQFAYFQMNKEDITFVGYPSENGQGAYVETMDYLFGITENCENKELAWDILCRMLKHHKKIEKNANDDTIGLPVLKEEMQRDYDRSESYAYSINSEIYVDLESDKKEYVPAEVKEKLYDYICSIPANPYIHLKLEYMINEEIEPVILSDRTSENAAEILQSRVSIYLSEKS